MVIGFFYLLLLTIVGPHKSVAQMVDLLPTSGSYEEENFDSDRYERKPRLGPQKRGAYQGRSPKKFEPIPRPKKEPKKENATTKEDDSRNTELPPKAKTRLEPSVTEDVQELMMGGSVGEIEELQKSLPPQDKRHNYIEIHVAPQFIYNESKSNYWYRDYNSTYPGVRLATDLWFGPFIGFQFDYTISVAASVRNQFGNNERAPVKDQWLKSGVVFRRFAEQTKTTPELGLTLGYIEYQRKFDSDVSGRMGLVSRSAYIGAQARWGNPQSNWVFGFDLRPFVHHSEVEASSDAKSGNDNETFGFGAQFGKEIHLDRSFRVFINLKFTYEKTQFKGNSRLDDPRGGGTVENTSVENSFSIIEAGFTWGD